MLAPPSTQHTQIDKQGRINLPEEIMARYGFAPGVSIRVELDRSEIRIERSVNQLSRVYIEPTNRCNLECRTCIRNVWDEPLGEMPWETYERILGDIQAFTPRPEIFLGGFGEPLVHPRIIDMVRGAKEHGSWVEMITNGILLTENTSAQLIDAGLDVVWVSVDGVSPESFADVRLGASLPLILSNLDTLLHLRTLAATRKPQVGIAYVAMKRNIHELPELIRMGIIKGIERFSISNLVAHTPELADEVLYEKTLIEGSYKSAFKFTDISFPRMDISAQTIEAYRKALQGNYRFQLSGAEVEKAINQCPFVHKGSTSVRWDGAISPCLPLLHTHESYLGKRLRRSHAYAFGNIMDHNLSKLWANQDYLTLRQRLQEFNFPPCSSCNSCEMADANLEDCFGNQAPVCGGCLWAQGLIQCP